MTDIVKRLRAEGAMAGHYDTPAIQREAADNIELLRAALRFYADPFKYTDIHGDDVPVPDFYSELDFGETARLTLKESER